MKDVQIAGYHLRFDWGTLMLMAEVAKTSPINPLQGITDQVEQVSLIFWGGTARVAERESKPTPFYWADCKKKVKDMDLKEVTALINTYMSLTKGDIEESAGNDGVTELSDEEKKS